ncbi:MAG: hypothetical protein ABFS41_11440 [Myxococcota bacterium]
MTLQDLGAIGELVGGVAVVFSLVYVAYQIRQNSRLIEQNSRQLEASMYFATNEAFNRWWLLLAQDEGTASLWRRGLQGELANGDERSRFEALMASLLTTFENNFVQQRLGAVHRDTLTISRDTLHRILSSPGGRDWWTRHSEHYLTPEFRRAIEVLVAAPGDDERA